MILLNKGFYKTAILPHLGEWALLLLQAEQVGKGLSRELLKGVLCGDTASTSLQCQLSEREWKLLNLAHDWLVTFLPHCLTKVNRVSFGLLTEAELQAAVDAKTPRSRLKLAILGELPVVAAVTTTTARQPSVRGSAQSNSPERSCTRAGTHAPPRPPPCYSKHGATHPDSSQSTPSSLSPHQSFS